MIILDEKLIPKIEPIVRPEGYPEHWIHPDSCVYIKDGKVINIIMLNPKDNLEELFKNQFKADSWIYTGDAYNAGYKTCPIIGYTYDGTDFYPPVEPTE